MYIECEHCKSGYELELPPAALASGRSVKFRCQSCGHSFHVVKDGEAVSGAVRGVRSVVESEVAQPEAAAPESASIQHVLLRQDGVSYHVPDVATLQRWIVERRVLPTDELDFGGGQWVEAGKRPDLAPFFAIVNEVESVTRKLADVETVSPAALHASESESSEPVIGEPTASGSASEALPADDDGPLSAESGAVESAPVEPDIAGAVEAELPVAPSDVSDGPPSEAEEPSMAARTEAPPAQVEPSEEDDAVAEAVVSPSTEAAPQSAVADAPPVADSVRKSDSQGVPDKKSLRSSLLFGSDAWPEIDAPSSPLSKSIESDLSVPIHAPDVPADASATEEGGLNWADKLFEEAPLPKAQAEGNVFDELDSDDETVEANRLMQEQPDFLEVGSRGGADDGEEEGWFAVEQGRIHDDDDDDLEFKSSSSSSGGLWFAVVVILCVGILIWQGSGSSLDVTSLKTPGGAGSGAIELATGGKPKAGPGDADPSSAPVEGSDGPPTATAPSEQAAPAGGEAGAGEPSTGAAGTKDGDAGKGAAPAEAPAAVPKALPKTAATVTQRGWRAVDRKRYAEAEQHFNSALKLRGSYAPATYGLGYVAHRRGDTNTAKLQFCKALSSAGGDVDLKREIEAGLRKMDTSCP